MDIRSNSSSQAGAHSFASSAGAKKKNALHLVFSKKPPADLKETKNIFQRTRNLFRHESVLSGLTYCLGKREKMEHIWERENCAQPLGKREKAPKAFGRGDIESV